MADTRSDPQKGLDSAQDKPVSGAKKTAREERLAQELRKNLRKRKAQERARQTVSDTDGET